MRIARHSCALLIASLAVSTAYAKPAPYLPALEYGSLLDSLRTGRRNIVDMKLVNSKPLAYRAWGAWTIPHSMNQVAAVALDFARYPETFTHVFRCERVPGPPKVVSPLGTWYLEGRAMMARVWAIGDIDTLRRDSLELHLIASGNENRRLEAQWRQVLPGWINFRTRGLRLAAFVVAHGPDSCRVGVLGETCVSRPMPEWILKFALSVVLPRLLEDLDREVARRDRRPKFLSH